VWLSFLFLKVTHNKEGSPPTNSKILITKVTGETSATMIDNAIDEEVRGRGLQNRYHDEIRPS